MSLRLSEPAAPAYDALLLVSFGGPESPGDVLPFLENVVRGRGVPRERMLQVAEHYQRLGGASPINEQNRALIRALQGRFDAHGPPWKVYFGNRNWHPLLPEAIRRMAEDGVQRALAFVTSAFSSYSGCRQYLENIEQARAQVGPPAPVVDKLRVFFNHPGFIGTVAERVRAALATLEASGRRAHLVFTAHSIPLSMAANSRYEGQLAESCRLVAEALAGSGPALPWKLAYQSRSGPPAQPWLEPDVNDCLSELASQGVEQVIIVPIGFLSDHMEVLYDLDVQAAALCQSLGIQMVRAETAGTHPLFVEMIHELVSERIDARQPRRAVGPCPADHDLCPADCCNWQPAARPA